jgi:hypothetical protein
MRRIAFVFLCLSLVVGMAQGATLRVGPDKPYKRPSDAAVAARDGDTVEVDAGTYRGDVAVWRQNDLTLRAVGGIAHLESGGRVAGDKAIWVIKGRRAVIESFEFSGAKSSDENGAGLRLEGADATIRNCVFHHNENGILGGKGEVLIEHSEFAHNGYGDGQSHNLYIIGGVKRLTFRYNYSHHARIGHNLKSRAQENLILYNRIMDEADGTASYAVDLPDAGRAWVIGNLIQQGPMTENFTLVSYGAESRRYPENALYVVNNTFVNDHATGLFVHAADGGFPVRLVNNLFVGPGKVTNRPVEERTNLVVRDAGLADRHGFDYRIMKNSPAIDAGSDPGTGVGYPLAPVSEYLHPRRGVERKITGTIDVGAYEFHDNESATGR